MRILALIPGGISDQLLFFPTLDTLKATYPDSKIDVVVEPRAVGTYKVKRTVAEVFPFDFAARSSLADWGNLLGIMRDREYDIAISPELTGMSSFVLWLAGIPKRVSFTGAAGGQFLNATVPVNLAQYQAGTNHDLLGAIGITSTLPDIAVNLTTADVNWADAERKRLQLSNGGYVVFYSRDGGYPVNSWESVLQEFHRKQPELPLVLLADAQNAEFSLAINDRVADLRQTQPAGLGQMIGMLAGASLVLCAEGDVLQAAIASQASTLAIFGNGDPTKLMPKSDRYIGVKSSSGKLADIAPDTILEKIF
jgi:ADP-heptose:LPS heptosyltransferase